VATITSCASSSQYSPRYGCENVFDGLASDWATYFQGVDSWIRLYFDELTVINTIEYVNRGAAVEANKDITLLFSDGSTQTVTDISITGSSIHTFTDVTTTSVEITVDKVWSTWNNGAREITFSYV